jgi:hypothetical protein
MPQLETAIVGRNNTKAAVTGQNELLVKVNSDTATFGVNLQGFTYAETWTDEEIILWVNDVELPKYEI